MFERTKIAERLWAQAMLCEEAARLYQGDDIAKHLETLAQNCRDVAFILLREQSSAH